MNCFNFQDHKYSFFNVSVHGLIELKTLKRKKKNFLPTETPPGICPRQQAAIGITLQSLFPYKTQSSFKKWLLPKVLG